MSGVITEQPKTAEVAVLSAVKETLTYSVPPELAPLVQAGQLVLIPLGREEQIGIIWALDVPYDKTITLKPIKELIDTKPILSAGIISLLRWTSEYYHFPPGEVAKIALPPGKFAPPTLHLRLKRPEDIDALVLKPDPGKGKKPPSLTPLEALLIGELNFEKPVSLNLIAKRKKRSLPRLRIVTYSLEQKGRIEVIREEAQGIAPPRTLRAFAITEAGKEALSQDLINPKAHSQKAVLAHLNQHGETPLRDLSKLVSSSASAISRLLGEGYITATSVEEERVSQSKLKPIQDNLPELTAEQKIAYAEIAEAISRKIFEPFLLFGVTGSGKTEIYLRSAERVLLEGGSALLLVPEIALTPNLARLARSRFGAGTVRIIHSALSAGERADGWRKIISGEARVVIGARSAVFAPLKNLRLIAVDEEHSSSYKQEDGLRYHGVHLALMRARLENCACILGSATPSVESYYLAEQKKYRLLTLTKRVYENPLPGVDIINLRNTPFSPQMPFHQRFRSALSDTLAKREQAIILVNRRGYAFFLICHDCGHGFSCPNCAVSLVYHQEGDTLRCHYCGHEEKPPERCPACDSENIKHFGIGVERVEEYLRANFRHARIARLDRDAITRKDQLDTVLSAMEALEIDILIGTQMVAKGHDFPRVTLVGIVLADTGMNLPDFRAAERLYQLVTQVSGRAGRGERPGRVVLQTFNPSHYAISSAISADYSTIYSREIEWRKKVMYPPFSRLCLIRVEGESEQEAKFSAQITVEHFLKLRFKQTQLLGPIASPIRKIRNLFRFQMLLKAKTVEARAEAIRVLQNFVQNELPPRVKVVFDLDPQNML